MAEVVVVGSYVQDLSFQTEQLPSPGETRLGTFRAGAGGKGFNQAVACARQDVVTHFLGAVADDLFALEAKSFVSNETALTASFEMIDSSHTGVASIVVDDRGQNQIIVALGANGAISTNFVASKASLLHDAQVVVTQLEMNLEAVHAALSIGREANSLTILDPAPIHPELTVEILQKADIITPNESEFRVMMREIFGIELSGRYWERADEELHALCAKCSVPLVLLTLGEDGVFMSRNPLPERINFGAGPSRIPAATARTVDTTGAGDAFTGGLAAGMIRFDLHVERAVEFASRVAALSTERAGTSPAMPYHFEVEERFRQ